MVFGHRHSREAVRGQLCEVVLPHCFCMGPSAWLRLIDLSGQGLLPTGLSHSLWSHFKRLVLNSFCARSLSLLWLYSPWLSRSLYPSSTALLGKTVQYVPQLRLSAVSVGSAEPWRSHPCYFSSAAGLSKVERNHLFRFLLFQTAAPLCWESDTFPVPLFGPDLLSFKWTFPSASLPY